MDRKKLPVELENNLLPGEKKYKMYYDYRKRTSGGFLDAVFLAGIMITGIVWLIALSFSVR